MRKLSVDKAGL